MDEPFHAVEAARQWRERVTGEVAHLSPAEKIAFFQRFATVAVLKAEPIPTAALPAVAPRVFKKRVDAVAESRKWKAAAARKTAPHPRRRATAPS